MSLCGAEGIDGHTMIIDNSCERAVQFGKGRGHQLIHMAYFCFINRLLMILILKNTTKNIHINGDALAEWSNLKWRPVVDKYEERFCLSAAINDFAA